MHATASSLTAVEANSQEILKSNQLLGIEIRGLSTHIASGFRDLGNQISRRMARALETSQQRANAINGAASFQAIVDLLQNRHDIIVDPGTGTTATLTTLPENPGSAEGEIPQHPCGEQPERNPTRVTRPPIIYAEETPPRDMGQGENSATPGPSTSRSTQQPQRTRKACH